MINTRKLTELLIDKVSHLVPPSTKVDGELVHTLGEISPDDESDIETVEFISRRFLEELQCDVMMETRVFWPLDTEALPKYCTMRFTLDTRASASR